MQKRAFPLDDVLSVLHAVQLTDDGREGLSKLIAYLTDGPEMPPDSQILLSGVMQVSPLLRSQLSELTAATVPPEFNTPSDALEWAARMKERHGDTVEVWPVY